MIDYNLAFKKPFSDFRKLIIGIILNIFPIINLISYGYILESSDIKRGKQTDEMAEWEDFTGFFVKGLLSFIVILIYSVPAMIVGAISLFAVFRFVDLEPFFRQIISMGPQRIQIMTPEKIFSLFDFSTLAEISLITLFSLMPLLLVLLILLFIAAYVSPVAVLKYIKTDNFSEAFNLNEITKYILTKEYVLAWLLVLVLNIVLVGLLSGVPILGAAIASFLSGMIGMSLYAGVMIEMDKRV